VVYCRLISHNNGIAIYAIGAVVSDITGLMRLNCNNRKYLVMQKPHKEEVYDLFIDKMIKKYQKEFDKGDIPEKMSYEI